MEPRARLSAEELERTEKTLFEQLGNAKTAYYEAKLSVARLNQVALDVGLNIPDGFVALRQAIAIESEARNRYAQALSQFTDFVIRYKPPRDLPGSSSHRPSNEKNPSNGKE